MQYEHGEAEIERLMVNTSFKDLAGRLIVKWRLLTEAYSFHIFNLLFDTKLTTEMGFKPS